MHLTLSYLLLLVLLAQPALASIVDDPKSVTQQVLSETMSSALSPNQLTSSDFKIEWVGAPIEGLQVSIEDHTLEWTRVWEVIEIPRGFLKIESQADDVGQVAVADAFQPLLAGGLNKIPVPLISGSQHNPIEIKIKRGDKVLKGKLQVRFAPKTPSDSPRVFTDPTCSRLYVEVKKITLPDDQWIFIGCRVTGLVGSEHRTSVLQAFVYWDNGGSSIEVGGIDTPPTSGSVWPLRLSPAPGEVTLKAAKGEVTLTYKIRENYHYGFLGAGIGPYQLQFTGGGENSTSIIANPTLYGSLILNETVKLVGFSSVTADSHMYTDTGIYLSMPYATFLDRRCSITVLLGAHAIGFAQTGSSYYLLWGAPQGFEFMVTDFLFKTFNLTMGGLLYPEISGKAYSNYWFRYGTGKVFGELNAISWQESVYNTPYKVSTIGLSIGFPITGFL